MDMTSNRPYLIRAYYDWMVDNDCTPHVVVDTEMPDVSVPQAYATNGQIVLNIAPRAIQNFVMDKESVSFNTRFGGVPCDIYIPINAILGVYARENGQGMAFQPERSTTPETGSATLRSVGPEENAGKNSPVSSKNDSKEGVANPLPENTDDEPPEPPSPSGGGHPHLRVVK